ncbi:MAG: hypothetical protein NZ899_04950 [Thermoguttaceae bacterium]|nr:hypothetical protein [Thermoguttaceae bacterium]MDW8077935.1 hypothetical protein [Thermoguttaceae bacterium]
MRRSKQCVRDSRTVPPSSDLGQRLALQDVARVLIGQVDTGSPADWAGILGGWGKVLPSPG